MYAFIVLFIVCSTVSRNGSLETRVVGGNNTLDGKYPYQVSIKMYGSHICGGSIINNRYILTAAHCITTTQPQVVKITVGTNRLFGAGEIYQAQELIRHPKYRDSAFIHDIGLIYVDRNIGFSMKVKPILLPFNYNVPGNTTIVVTGWGRLSFNGSVPYILQELNATVITNTVCLRYYSDIMENHICTFMGPNKGVCNGDSGGPLVMNNVQVGIVSYGRPCAIGSPDVYTRVYPYKSWINNEISKWRRNNVEDVHRGNWATLLLATSTIVSYLHLSS